jgi:hypothetical protein
MDSPVGRHLANMMNLQIAGSSRKAAMGSLTYDTAGAIARDLSGRFAPSGPEGRAAGGAPPRTAKRYQARSLELRATSSLARLRRDREKRGEARDLLARSDGFGTADLETAKALLHELC